MEVGISSPVADELSDILAPAEALKLAGGGASEGPVWHPGGYLTFVRHKISELVRWDPSGDVKVIRRDTGNGNGCTLDLGGRLVMCEGGRRRVTRTEPDGTITTIAERWRGRRLNRPSDIVCRTDGSIYFTDPGLMIPREERELGFAGIFRITPDGEIQVATDECEYPNGLAFSPDESVMYVAITRTSRSCIAELKHGDPCRHRFMRAFDVAADGTLRNGREFVDMTSSDIQGPDGVKVDADGRVYCAGAGGIWVVDPDGRRLGIIRLPEEPRNLAFGGPGFRTMFVTAGESLYRLETKVRGIGAFGWPA